MTSSCRSFYKGLMSIQKSSVNRLTIFFESLRGNLNVSRELCLEQTAPAATAARQPVQSNREMMKEEDLDRYYAKPGEAEWGC